MTNPLGTASLSYAGGRVNFQGATGLKMPFSGAVIIPRPAGETPDLNTMPAQHSLFVPLWFPQTAPNGGRLFNGLRTMDGSRLSESDPLIVFVAEDPGVFDEFDLGAIFSDGGVVTSQFPKTGTLTSCRPKFLVLRLDAGAQPAEAGPKIAADGQNLSTIVGGLPGSFSGTVMAFDFAGLEIEADAALAVLGATNITGTPGNANTMRVQFVDVLGTPLDSNALFGLQLEPALADQDPTRKLYKLQFPTANRSLEIRVTDPIPANVNDDDKYLLRNCRVAVWPGREAELTTVTENDPDFDLKDGANGDTPAFVRLCVFHPSQTMQNDFGGLLDEHARFTNDKGTTPANGFALSAEADEVVLFNDGESYLRDVYEAIDAAQSGDKVYINNWSSHAHTHMRGTLSRMGLGPVDLAGSTVNEALQSIDQNRIVVAVGSDGKDWLSLPDQLDRSATLSAGFQYETRRVPTVGIEDKALNKGFFRPDGILAFPFKGANDQPFPSRLIARWKDLAGGVHQTEHTLDMGIAPLAPVGQIATSLTLGITTDDPPVGTVIRTTHLVGVRVALGVVTGPLWLLVVNVTTGRHILHDLTISPAATDVELGVLPEDTSATDAVYALVLNDDPAPDDALSNLIVSRAVKLSYSTNQHLLGDIPLADDELGALLRRAIANDVEVRAIYWDQFLANLGSGDDFDSGHTNNEELTAIINTERNSRHGWAIRDRSTRAFGSFHQKGVVLMRGAPPEAVAWLGGIDLALGRWDTELHHDTDPARQSGKWWDAQVKLTGPAAVDVLRNFSQRWRALGEFIKDPNRFQSCIPIAPTPAITTDTSNPIQPPAAISRTLTPVANVQITRTCPPRSCHGDIPKAVSFGQGIDPLGDIAPEGELGSLASYLKAINMARRYILINDQYFFSPEIALALHEAMKKPDGPAALILMLPKDLGEDPRIDPMLFKVREKALQVLFHGGVYTPPPVPAGNNLPEIQRPHCGHITANATDPNSVVPAKTALVFARNHAAGKVYVHSKMLIVDDVWMSVGSANLNYRSSTYDFEINAGIVGNKIDFGGTDVVRRQRIELARRMLGLPQAYAPLIADSDVMFAHFKAIENGGNNPSHTMHPLAPMSQKLDPAYVKKVGDAAFDNNVDIVSALDMNSQLVTGIACNIVDPDGRAAWEALGPFAGIVGNSTRAYARITVTIACQALVSGLINAGTNVFAEIRVTEAQGAPRRAHLVPLELSGNTVVPSPSTGELVVPISTSELVVIAGRVIDDADVEQGCMASVSIDPDQELELPGSLREIGFDLGVPV